MKKKHGPTRVIPTNMEKFLSLSVGQLQFLDSMQYTAGASLNELIKTLNDDEFYYTKQAFPNEEHFNLVKEKGIFPYDYFDHLDKLKDYNFPKRNQFFNTLADTECKVKEYLRAKLVWKKMKCKTFKDYHDIYLKTDVLLLPDFFEIFRQTCVINYGLDACHYYSAPGQAWDSSVKTTGVELRLFDNERMYTFVERSIRGGISMITKRYVKANNPGCKKYHPA